MVVNGSNTFEWEPCVKVLVLGTKVIHQPALRVRQKDTLISLLGVNLGAWGPWQWVDDEPVYRLPDGTACDATGAPT